jgi:hypothetical protein
MALKKPRQEQPRSTFKIKEMLVLSGFSLEAQQKFEAAKREAATKARYTGSAYHRAFASKAGPVASRAGLTSRCPAAWTNIEATRVLRLAITDGRVSMGWEHGFPKYVWHLDEEGGVLYEGCLTNSGNGEYHGYPLEDNWQWPKNFR